MSGGTAWRPDDPAWLAALGQAASAIGSDGSQAAACSPG
jgi:hypothetical protein